MIAVEEITIRGGEKRDYGLVGLAVQSITADSRRLLHYGGSQKSMMLSCTSSLGKSCNTIASGGQRLRPIAYTESHASENTHP